MISLRLIITSLLIGLIISSHGTLPSTLWESETISSPDSITGFMVRPLFVLQSSSITMQS